MNQSLKGVKKVKHQRKFVKKNMEKAVYYYNLAAEQGNPIYVYVAQ